MTGNTYECLDASKNEIKYLEEEKRFLIGLFIIICTKSVLIK